MSVFEKGDTYIQFTLPNGDTISDRKCVELEQLQHAFYFGVLWLQIGKCLNAWYPEFKSQFANLFNYATIDFFVHSVNKANGYMNPSSREKLDWAKSQGMRLRGHPLMWRRGNS